jgi:hypothetical protein
MKIIALVVLAMLLCVTSAVCQTETATISGRVTDPSGAALSGADVQVQNVLTGRAVATKTNSSGLYVATALQPGTYRVIVSNPGFKQIVKPDIVLNVQDNAALNFSMTVGSVSETVTVTGGAPLVNTESAAVSTVVDRQFVENMPLNGRSFQTLIALTPGTVITPTSSDSQGQFSVNGQRTDANYFTVDGVSANAGTNGFNPVLYQSAGGALPALSTLGGTSSLVSVDALQEFRIQTSSYAPEFGRQPGAQVSILTRSGTNSFHGNLFDYFRNDVLDANDWFSNHNHLPKAAERQNDFGGTFGGPIVKDRTFVFLSYEGLRLRQPRTLQTIVPDLASRQAATPDELPYLNAFPLPNGASLGSGTAQFNQTYSDPSSVNAFSIRIDHTINSKTSIFGRYNYSPSDTSQRGAAASFGAGYAELNNTQAATSSTQTFTLGIAEAITPRITNEFRANYSNVRAGNKWILDNFGGAVPPSDSILFPTGFSAENGISETYIAGVGLLEVGKGTTNEQRQLNFLDNVSMAFGRHQLKVGFDYRWLSPFTSPSPYNLFVYFAGVPDPSGILSGQAVGVFPGTFQGTSFLVKNYSAYAQDTWKATARLTLTYGLRWDVNPPLKGKTAANQPFTVQGLDNPLTMTLAPRGTPLYSTTYGNIAPRFGIAYQLGQNDRWGTVLRAGFGVFYDLGGQTALGSASGYFPFSYQTFNSAPVPLPLMASDIAPPAISLAPPVGNNMVVTVPDLTLPRTYQWNASAEQMLGPKQTLSLTYLGAVGRDLLREDSYYAVNATFPNQVAVYRNTATSDYHSLQVSFQRRLSRGMEALASYTLAHSIDIASTDNLSTSSQGNVPPAIANPRTDRGNSDYDIRHSFSGAITYDVPSPWKQPLAHAVFGGWSLNGLIIARSSPPVNVAAGYSFVNGIFFQPRPDVQQGQALNLYGSQYPGGKAFNQAAFTQPTGSQGDFGRNILRGFAASQFNFALQRTFKIKEGLSLRWRSEFFNILNHPNFGSPDGVLTDPQFGLSTQTLATSLGSGGSSGGFNPLYQIGGPRSIQFALKLQF